MLNRKLKIAILITTIVFSLSVMLFFVIQNFANTRNLDQMVEDYDVEVQPTDDSDQNLKPNVILDAIKIKELNKAIMIKLDKNNLTTTTDLQIIFKVIFNEDMFQYLFLKLIIKTFPQWKINNFTFNFNIFMNAVWVQYNTDLQTDYLNWSFKIASKI